MSRVIGRLQQAVRVLVHETSFAGAAPRLVELTVLVPTDRALEEVVREAGAVALKERG